MSASTASPSPAATWDPPGVTSFGARASSARPAQTIRDLILGRHAASLTGTSRDRVCEQPGSEEPTGWTARDRRCADRDPARRRLPRRPRAGHRALRRALTLDRPILLEGEVGVGKTEIAKALAHGLRPQADPAAVLRGHRHQPGPVRMGLRPADAADPRPVRAPAGPTTTARSDQLFGPKFLLERPLLEAVRAGRPGRPAHRRGRPRRRRVRGVPARVAVRLPDHHPRDRHDQGRGAAAGRADLQPDPRAARRAEAALPLPLGRLSRPPSARSRSSWSGRPDVSAALARKVGRGRAAGCASWTWPSRPGWPRRSTGCGPSRSSARPSLDVRDGRRHPRRGGQGPRRPGGRARQPVDHDADRRCLMLRTVAATPSSALLVDFARELRARGARPSGPATC